MIREELQGIAFYYTGIDNNRNACESERTDRMVSPISTRLSVLQNTGCCPLFIWE